MINVQDMIPWMHDLPPGAGWGMVGVLGLLGFLMGWIWLPVGRSDSRLLPIGIAGCGGLVAIGVMGASWWATGQPQTSWEYFEKQTIIRRFATTLDQATPETRRALLQRVVGTMEQRLAATPGDYTGHMLLAKLYGLQGNWDRAVEIYHRFMKTHGQSVEFLVPYARALFERDKGFSPVAATLVRQAQTLDPQQPEVLVLSALLAWQEGRMEQAEAAWMDLAAQTSDPHMRDQIVRQINKWKAQQAKRAP